MVSSRVLMRASTTKLLPSCRNQVLCCVVDHRTRALAWWAEFWPGVSLPLNLFPVSLLLGGYYRFTNKVPIKLCASMPTAKVNFHTKRCTFRDGLSTGTTFVSLIGYVTKKDNYQPH